MKIKTIVQTAKKNMAQIKQQLPNKIKDNLEATRKNANGILDAMDKSAQNIKAFIKSKIK